MDLIKDWGTNIDGFALGTTISRMAQCKGNYQEWGWEALQPFDLITQTSCRTDVKRKPTFTSKEVNCRLKYLVSVSLRLRLLKAEL